MVFLRPRGATPPPARPRPAHAGFTMVELLLVIAMVGAVVAIAMPRMRSFRDSSAVRSARLQLGTAVEAARGAAVQRGRTARVRVRGDSVIVFADTGGASGPSTGTFTVLATIALRKEHQVRVTLASPGDTMIGYDSRGLTSPRLANTRIYVIERGAFRDSVCVSRLGMLLPARCTP
jgi:prepilin-type N-terminal cleavage/methylation domain-containing protein